MSSPVIRAREVSIGNGVSFGEGVQIGAIGGEADSVVIGDQVRIGEGVRILAKNIAIGDYCVLHSGVTVYGYEDFALGHCCWVGQQAILNCTGRLSIGRGVTISALASIWTHFSGGDPLIGCRFNSVKEASVGDDAWIGVQCSVAPVDIGARALLLAGSIVTKDVPENTVWGGNPATDLTQKLGRPYAELSAEQRFRLLCERLIEWHDTTNGKPDGAPAVSDLIDGAVEDGALHAGGIRLALADSGAPDTPRGESIFDVRNRSYSKLGTEEEISFMRHLLPTVKFYPRG